MSLIDCYSEMFSEERREKLIGGYISWVVSVAVMAIIAKVTGKVPSSVEFFPIMGKILIAMTFVFLVAIVVFPFFHFLSSLLFRKS